MLLARRTVPAGTQGIDFRKMAMRSVALLSVSSGAFLCLHYWRYERNLCTSISG